MYCYMQKLSAATLIVLSKSKSRLVEKFSKAKAKSRLLLVISEVGRRQRQAPKASPKSNNYWLYSKSEGRRQKRRKGKSKSVGYCRVLPGIAGYCRVLRGGARCVASR